MNVQKNLSSLTIGKLSTPHSDLKSDTTFNTVSVKQYSADIVSKFTYQETNSKFGKNQDQTNLKDSFGSVLKDSGKTDISHERYEKLAGLMDQFDSYKTSPQKKLEILPQLMAETKQIMGHLEKLTQVVGQQDQLHVLAGLLDAQKDLKDQITPMINGSNREAIEAKLETRFKDGYATEIKNDWVGLIKGEINDKNTSNLRRLINQLTPDKSGDQDVKKVISTFLKCVDAHLTNAPDKMVYLSDFQNAFKEFSKKNPTQSLADLGRLGDKGSASKNNWGITLAEAMHDCVEAMNPQNVQQSTSIQNMIKMGMVRVVESKEQKDTKKTNRDPIQLSFERSNAQDSKQPTADILLGKISSSQKDPLVLLEVAKELKGIPEKDRGAFKEVISALKSETNPSERLGKLTFNEVDQSLLVLYDKVLAKGVKPDRGFFELMTKLVPTPSSDKAQLAENTMRSAFKDNPTVMTTLETVKKESKLDKIFPGAMLSAQDKTDLDKLADIINKTVKPSEEKLTQLQTNNSQDKAELKKEYSNLMVAQAKVLATLKGFAEQMAVLEKKGIPKERLATQVTNMCAKLGIEAELMVDKNGKQLSTPADVLKGVMELASAKAKQYSTAKNSL